MHQLGEALRVVLVREVAGVGDDLDPGLGGQGGGVGGVAHRDDPVVAAPDDRHRHLLGEVGAVGHGDDLAAPVDDRPDDVPDGRAGEGVAERVVDLGDLVEVAGGLEPGAGQRLETGLAGVAYAGEREQPHDLVEAGRGQHPDPRAHLGAEPARGDQDHPLGALGELVGELHRDAAPEAVADDRDLVDPEERDQVAHPVGVAAQAVVGARLGRLAVAQQVGGDHRVAAGQRVDDRLPRGVVAAETVQEQERGPGADLDVRAAVAVERDVLDLVLERMLLHHLLPRRSPQWLKIQPHACCLNGRPTRHEIVTKPLIPSGIWRGRRD